MGRLRRFTLFALAAILVGRLFSRRKEKMEMGEEEKHKRH